MKKILLLLSLIAFFTLEANSAPRKTIFSKNKSASSFHKKAKIKKIKLNAKKMKPVIFPEKVKDNSATYEDYVRIVPSDIQGSASEAYVATKFGDQALQNFLNSPQVQNSSMGKTANTMQNAMKADVNLGGGGKEDPGSVNHKLSVQYMALQSQAKVAYSGWTNATVRMDNRSRETGVEISEKVFHNKDLVINHTKNPFEAKSSVGLRWSW